MSARREASTPPTIPGYEYARLLGMGGFADVFLYRQLMPRRHVAVKVLLASSLDDDARARFRTEADLMASLSHHPSIVTVHLADVAPDGRPFLVMEYCSRPGLGQRYRAERMGVAEVLRIGIRLASAVETAHRAGILHRDIKPANVLITDFGWPALTDFGIAATTGLAGASVGMSIPWSPPELLAEVPQGDARADVYSLAATVFSLLARRSPFEVPDGSNTAADLIGRIERSPLGSTGRGDVPDSLQAVLARAMDKLPARRHHSALAFARALQVVEAELMLPLTPLDLPEELEAPTPRVDDGAGEAGQATRLRPVRSVSPDEPEAAGPASPWAPVDQADAASDAAPAPAPSPAPAAAARPVPAPEAAARPAPASEAAAPPAPAPALAPSLPTAAPVAGPRPAAPAPHADLEDVPTSWQPPAAPTTTRPVRARRGGSPVVAAVAGLVVVLAVVGAAYLSGRPSAPTEPTGSPTASPQPTGLRAVPSPTDLAGTRAADGSVTFTWTNPEPVEGDRYLWGISEPGVEPDLEVVDSTTLTLAAEEAIGEVCVEVSIVRTTGWSSTEAALGCVP